MHSAKRLKILRLQSPFISLTATCAKFISRFAARLRRPQELSQVFEPLPNLLNAVENKEYIERLQMVIHHLHGADSKWLESIPVLETFQGKTVWEGDVELFELTNHPKAKRCYAWSDEHPQNEQMTAVLEFPPVKNANDAVKVHIVQQAKKGRQ